MEAGLQKSVAEKQQRRKAEGQRNRGKITRYSKGVRKSMRAREPRCSWSCESTWRPCPGRRQMRSLDPSAQMGTLWGKL